LGHTRPFELIAAIGINILASSNWDEIEMEKAQIPDFGGEKYISPHVLAFATLR
jgi:hypothetical protein